MYEMMYMQMYSQPMLVAAIHERNSGSFAPQFLSELAPACLWPWFAITFTFTVITANSVLCLFLSIAPPHAAC
ncbi:uncharacterized protein SCHCODRAFT_02616810 [Schizophyllum commune H4-8]|uniref:uncharacterized protein n=1 Tax=Schizophyllum commune (strain H4-8 / FGSC 9210) TaxID=578458 RepID=UPI00215E706F|nr:uncharacterized protein SCHCODRAFT_02616810 [Schizophyllum commune H4-8]KAI5897138.1 hypothetical protein SCHCODRAFT_02616810 [Schizophyllum commune H4-8]